MRKMISMVLVVMMSMVMMSVPVLAAANDSGIMPMSIETTASCSLSISNMTATSSCTVAAYGSDSISVTLHLQKYKNGAWETVKTKTQSTTNDSLNISMTKLITAGQFRTKAVVTVKQSGKTETSTKYSATKTKS